MLSFIVDKTTNAKIIAQNAYFPFPLASHPFFCFNKIPFYSRLVFSRCVSPYPYVSNPKNCDLCLNRVE